VTTTHATSSIIDRTPLQRLSLVGAVLFAVAPLSFGLFRYASTGWDRRILWMALVASVFAASVLVSAIGKRRSRHQALVQSAVIAVVGALLAVGTGKMLGETAGPGVWMVGAVQGILLGVASELITFARVKPH
jgi:hypothetical protein